MATLDQLRTLFPDAKTDADIIRQASDEFGISPGEIAAEVGYATPKGGITRNQFSSSFDQYKAGLYGVGEEVTKALGAEGASNWMGAQRRENELQADLASERARSLGAVDRWADVHSIGDFGSYFKGTAIQSAPYALEAITGGLEARALMGGTRAALRAAEATGDIAAAAKARRALDIGSDVGMAVQSYPSAVGDVLSNQREQNGQTDLASAAGLGVPYAAANVLGIESAIGRGNAFRNTINLLDKPGGLGGAALRATSTGVTTGLKEGGSETFQEMMNQAGRIAVDPNAEMFSPEAQERYKESFIGGAILGGGMASTMGGWRRSGNDIQQAFQTTQEGTDPLAGRAPLTTESANYSQAPTMEQAPALSVGQTPGTTDVAIASQQAAAQQTAQDQATAQQAAAQQTAQDQVATQQEAQVQAKLKEQTAREDTFQTLGASLTPDNGGTLTVFGQSVFGPQIATFGNALAGKVNALDPLHRQLVQAVSQANAETGNRLVSFKYTGTNPIGSAEKAVVSLSKAFDTLQIGHVQTVEQAAAILNTQSKTAKGDKLEQINAVHAALTGEDTAGFIAATAAQPKGVKNGQLQLQNNAGLRDVREQVGAGETNPANAGTVRPGSVQPIESGSQPEGSLGLQVGQPAGSGVRTGPSVSAAASNVLAVGQGNGPGQITELSTNTLNGIQSGVATADPDMRDIWAEQLQRKLDKKGTLTWQDIPQDLSSAMGTIEFSALKEGLAVNPQQAISLIRGDQNITPTQESANEQVQTTSTQTGTNQLQGSAQIPGNGRNDGASQGLLGAATTSSEEVNEAEQTIEGTGSLLRDLLGIVFRSKVKIEFLATFVKGETNKTHAEIGAELGLQPGTITDYAQMLRIGRYETVDGKRKFVNNINGTFRFFLDNQAKFQSAVALKAEQLETTPEEILRAFSTLTTAYDAQGELGTGDENDLAALGLSIQKTVERKDKEGKGTGKVDRTNRTSLAEQGNSAEDLSNRYLKVADALTKLESQADRKPQSVAFLVAEKHRLEAEIAKVVEAEANKVRARAGQVVKEKTDASMTGELSRAERDQENEVDAPLESDTATGSAEAAVEDVEEESDAEEQDAAKVEARRKLKEEEEQIKKEKARKAAEERTKATLKERKGLAVGDTVVNPKLGTGEVVSFAGNGADTRVTVEFKSGQTKELLVSVAKLEKTNASEKQGAGALDVEEQPEDGGAVGEGNTQPQKPAGKGKRQKAPAKVKAEPVSETKEVALRTDDEKAGAAWDDAVKDYPTAPKWADLTDAQRKTFVEYGEDNWTAEDVQGELVKLAKAGQAKASLKFGVDSPIANPYTVEELTKDISDFVRSAINTRRLKIVADIGELLRSSDPAEQKLGAALALKGAFGVSTEDDKGQGRAYLIANRISKGQGRAKFMHEVGAHLGLEGLLTDEQFDNLTDKIFEWAMQENDSREATLARKAIMRADAAETADKDLRSEILAYFIEEAMQSGVQPSAAMKLGGPLGMWFRTLWAAFKLAIRRLGMNPDAMNAQDIVNMAYGAARLEMHGTFHGTAAEFRRFNHEYMGTGEGKQAYGWGTYIAQNFGVAKGYWIADVKRKTNANGQKPTGSVMRVDIGVDQKDMLDWDTPLSKQPAILVKLEATLPQSVKDDLLDELNLDLNEMTGEDLYQGLKSLEMKTGAVSKLFDVADYNKRLANQSAKRIVSAYLDEVVGVPGLKFLDAVSRGKSADLIKAKIKTVQQILDEQQLDLDKAVAEADKWESLYDKAPPDKKTYARATWLTAVSKRASLQFIVSQTEQSVASLKAELEGLNNKTQNLVVFNDKNIFRASSRINNQRSNMKFGVAMPTQEQATQTMKSMPKALRSSAELTWTNMFRNAALPLMMTEDVVALAKKYMRSAPKYLESQFKRMAERIRVEGIVDGIIERFEKLPADVQKQVNKYIFDSTMNQSWGYYPGAHRVGTTLFEIDDDYRARFEAIEARSPEAAQLIKDTFEHGYQMLLAKQKAVHAMVDREFADREKAAIGDVDALQALAKEKKAARVRASTLMNIQVDKPYAYLARYGDFIVVAKSKEFKHFQEQAQSNDISRTDQQIAKNWLDDNTSNPDHYVVQFAETQGEADRIAADLMSTGKYDIQADDAGPKEANGSYTGGDAFVAVKRLMNMVGRGGEADPHMEKLLSELYLATISEASARKSEIQRKYVAGANDNMMRNLATSGRADAHFLSTVAYNDEITESLEAMRAEATNNRRDAMPLYNEVYARYNKGLDYDPAGPLVKNLTRTTSIWNLAMNPAYYLQQLLQTEVLSVPYMAGRIGYFRAQREMSRAYREVAALVKGLKFNDHVDFNSAAIPSDVRPMLQKLVGMGKIDIGIEAESKALAGETTPLAKVMRKLQGVNNRIETINRTTAAIAAYRGYLRRYGSEHTEAATQFAADVVSNTHGSYDGFSTPRALNNTAGRVFGQFKRFQIIQLSMLAKLIHNSFKGASQEEKVIARRALGFIVAHMAVLGGALGVPFVSQLGSLLLSMVPGDEPDDLETYLRGVIDDEAISDLLLRGVPSAIGLESLGKKLAMENVASLTPFVDFDLSSRSGMEKTIIGMMGPSVSLGLKFADGIGQMAQGSYYKGLEQMMPSGIANAMKGIRMGTEGLTMRNGDTVMGGDDITALDAAFQAVGLPTNTITDRQRLQSVVKNTDKFYQDASTEIKNDYTKAFKSGDSESMAAAREAWAELQASRRAHGYQIQPISNLFKAPMEQQKRERNIAGGVEFNKGNRGFVQQQSNQ
jgi:hypothetical protein